MPGAMEIDQVGQKQEISEIVFNIRADETPFTSMLPKDKKPHNKLPTWQVETYRAGSLAGVMDNADVAAFNSEPRFLLTGVAQKVREPWSVSDFADETDVAGLASGEKGQQKLVAAKVLKFSMEGRCLSKEACTVDNGVAIPNATRGALEWIDNAAQTLYPVPAAFRPALTNIYTDDLADFTESEFEAMGQSAFKERKGKLNLDGFVGIDLQAQMDNWTARDPEATAANYPVRSWTQDANKKAFIKVVNFFTFSWGQVRTHLSTYIYLDADGAETDYTHKSGLFADMSMWALGFMRKPRMGDLPDLGGGPRGFADAIMVLKCRNPLGQMKVETDA